VSYESYHRWLPRMPPPGCDLALICFPFAGARWTIFRAWADELPSSIGITPADYPPEAGSGGRALDAIDDLVQAARVAVSDVQSRSIALYGHSFGALVAFELAKQMAADGEMPTALIVSGHRAPGLALLQSPIHELPSAAFMARLWTWGGIPAEIMHDAQAMALFEPALRAHMRLAETYMPTISPPLTCPIVAIAGLFDPLAPPDSMEDWRRHTTGRFALETIAGDHFFPLNQRPHFLSVVARRLVSDWG
jgi:surfactin synthase thioesterase subunit